MAPTRRYRIDLTPQHTINYWRIEIIAWLIKTGDPENQGGFHRLPFASDDVIRAEFSLALTCPQLTEIRRGRNMDQIWDRLESIFEYCGPVKKAPLFRQLAHQCLDERPEMKELLRKFLDEIEEEDSCPLRPSPLTVVRKLVTEPEIFEFRKKATDKLGPVGMLNGVKRLCGCNPYVPINEITGRERSLLNCKYCKHSILLFREVKEGDTTVDKPIRLYNGYKMRHPWLRPYLKTRLFSIIKATESGHRIMFWRVEVMILSSTGRVKFRANRPRPPGTELDEVTTQPSDHASLATWHRRLGHIDFRDLLSGHKKSAYRGLKLPKQSKYDLPSCRICEAVKLPVQPLRQEPRTGARVFQIVHADFCGPIPGRSEDTVLYLISFTDDASGWMTIYTANNTTSTLKYFKKYVNQIEHKFGRQIQSLQSNDDLGKAFDDYLRAKGIMRRKRPTDTYHIHALLETAKCLLMQSGLDDTLYSEALFTACYIRNRSSSARLDGLTPFQKWFGRPPSVRHMQEFGARVTCMATKGQKKGELETKEGRYLAFTKKNEAYKIWIPDYKQVVLSKEVHFHENVDPQEENDTRAERRRSNAGGTVERPSTSNSEAGTSGGQTRAVTPKKDSKILNNCSSYDSKHLDYSGAPQRNDRDCNDYMSGGRYNIPGSSEEDSDSDGYEEEIINEENESDASGKGKDDNDVGEPTATNKPVKDSPEEQTPAQPSAQSSAQPSPQPSGEGEGPGAIPRNTHHVHVL